MILIESKKRIDYGGRIVILTQVRNASEWMGIEISLSVLLIHQALPISPAQRVTIPNKLTL